MGPMTINQAEPSGRITPWIVDWYCRRAQGGVGTIIGAAAFVSQNGRGWANAVGISNDSHTEGWEKCARTSHSYGALFGVQLFHGGAASPAELLGHPPVSASVWTSEGGSEARALSKGEVEQIIQDFAEGARRSIEAGCDFVELHGAHGYLLHQFSRRDVNRRDDEWGDPVAFPVAVTRAVRAAIGPDVPLLYRLSIHADAPDSPNHPVNPIELERFIMSLEAAGVDVWDVSCHKDSRRGYFGTEVLLPDWVRKFSARPRIVAGSLNTPEEASVYIGAGHAEAAAVAKALIMDANWVKKAREGQSTDIRSLDTGEWWKIYEGIDPGV